MLSNTTTISFFTKKVVCLVSFLFLAQNAVAFINGTIPLPTNSSFQKFDDDGNFIFSLNVNRNSSGCADSSWCFTQLKSIETLNVQSGALSSSLITMPLYVTSTYTFTKDNKELFASHGSKVLSYEVSTGKVLKIVPYDYSSEITFMKVANDKSWILTSEKYWSNDQYFRNTIKKVDIYNGHLLFEIKNDLIFPTKQRSTEFFPAAGRYFRVSPDEKKLYMMTETKDGKSLNLFILNIETGKTSEVPLFKVNKLIEPFYEVGFDFSADDNFLIVSFSRSNYGNGVDEFAVVGVRSDIVKFKKEYSGNRWKFTISQNAKKIAVKGIYGGDVELYDTDTFLKNEMPISEGRILGDISLSHDGQYLAAIRQSDDAEVVIFDTKTLKKVQTIEKSRIPLAVTGNFSYFGTVRFLGDSNKLFGDMRKCIDKNNCSKMSQIIWTMDLDSNHIQSTQALEFAEDKIFLSFLFSPNDETVLLRTTTSGNHEYTFKVFGF